MTSSITAGPRPDWPGYTSITASRSCKRVRSLLRRATRTRWSSRGTGRCDLGAAMNLFSQTKQVRQSGLIRAHPAGGDLVGKTEPLEIFVKIISYLRDG